MSQFFINADNQWQFRNSHDKQISKLSLIFEFDGEFTEIFKIEDKAQLKQAEKPKCYEMKDEGWKMNDESWKMMDECWKMKDECWKMNE